MGTTNQEMIQCVKVKDREEETDGGEGRDEREDERDKALSKNAPFVPLELRIKK